MNMFNMVRAFSIALVLTLLVVVVPMLGAPDNWQTSGETASLVQQPLSSSRLLNFEEGAAHLLERRSSGKFCGPNLVKAMALICKNIYAEPSLKRSYNSVPSPNYAHALWRQVFNMKANDLTTWTELARQYDALFGEEDEGLSRADIFERIASAKANNALFSSGERRSLLSDMLVRKTRQSRPRIADECCRKPCTVKFMTTFCKNPMGMKSDDYS